jgi:tRNA-specific 2-thiouridylase
VLGRHDGISGFTIGQRRGLGLSSDRPLYVLGVDAPSRRVVVGGADDLMRECCTVERTRWLPFERPGGTLRAEVRIRSGHAGARATISDRGHGRAEVRFEDAQRAIAPGQAAVFYDGDLVLGGGWITPDGIPTRAGGEDVEAASRP